MSAGSGTKPDQTFDGGMLEINADKIEARLNSMWKQATASFGTAMPVAKLCLSNMVVITDQASRREAELVTYELAAGYPSRVILLALDEDTEKYSAFVRTSCTRDTETSMIRCWEVIELEADISQLDRLPGALRSLLVGSVPVVSIDFRRFQTTPRLDAEIMELSDYYFINADVVPSNGLKKAYLPMRWYRTLIVRELIGELVSRVTSLDCTAHPVRIQTIASLDEDTHSDLLTGWILHRLGGQEPVQRESTITVESKGSEISIEQLPYDKDAPLVRIHFSTGLAGEIRRVHQAKKGELIYRAIYGDIVVERKASAISFSRYVIGTLRDRSEFAEFASANDALDRIVQK